MPTARVYPGQTEEVLPGCAFRRSRAQHRVGASRVWSDEPLHRLVDRHEDLRLPVTSVGMQRRAADPAGVAEGQAPQEARWIATYAFLQLPQVGYLLGTESDSVRQGSNMGSTTTPRWSQWTKRTP
jgi:hypothetical protein